MYYKIKKYYLRFKYFRNVSCETALIDIPSKIKVYYGGSITFKGAVYIGEDSFIDARGGLIIGKNVIFGPRVSILTYNHDHKDKSWAPYSPNIIEKETLIGDHCWFGLNSIILPGTKVGSNCIIGAGSVLNGIYPDNSVIVGNPAKVVKKLEKNDNPEEYQTKMSEKRRWG
ncbi:acyltransferase [Pseudoalteromonas fuliginea]|uniref:acyltransferase n=1 Tax=Pseudoalteromonas fuliginea TaxID=1872678 RepID=UPI003175A973